MSSTPEIRHTTSVDLATITEVRGEDNPSAVNLLLMAGWTLLAVGVDYNGFPTMVVGKPAPPTPALPLGGG